MAAMFGMSIAYILPPEAVSWVCSLSQDAVETKCRVDPGFVYNFVNTLEQQFGITIGPDCRNLWVELERICRGRGEVFAKTQFDRDEICQRYRHSLPELAQRVCQELPQYCGLPPSVVYQEICSRGLTYAKVQQTDLPTLCRSGLSPPQLHQRICWEYPQYCDWPLSTLCPNGPSRSFARFQQPNPIQGIQVFVRILNLCRSVSNQPETDINQKVEDLCNTASQTTSQIGGGVPPPLAKVKESIATLCYPAATNDIEVVRTECEELKNLPFPPSLRDMICNRQPDLPICNPEGLSSVHEKICMLHPSLPFCNSWETTATTPSIP